MSLKSLIRVSRRSSIGTLEKRERENSVPPRSAAAPLDRFAGVDAARSMLRQAKNGESLAFFVQPTNGDESQRVRRITAGFAGPWRQARSRRGAPSSRPACKRSCIRPIPSEPPCCPGEQRCNPFQSSGGRARPRCCSGDQVFGGRPRLANRIPCISAAFWRIPARFSASLRAGPWGMARACSSATSASICKSCSARVPAFLSIRKN